MWRQGYKKRQAQRYEVYAGGYDSDWRKHFFDLLPRSSKKEGAADAECATEGIEKDEGTWIPGHELGQSGGNKGGREGGNASMN